MHLILDEAKGHKAIACIEREAGTARILQSCCDAHQQQLEDMIAALGVPAVTMEVMGKPAAEWLAKKGWTNLPDVTVMVKELRK